MNLATNRLLKVLVRNLAILVSIKLVEQALKLDICYTSKPPVLEVESQFLGLYGSRLLSIEIHECLSQSFPLELYLIQNCPLKLPRVQSLTCKAFCRQFLRLFLVHLIIF